MIYSDSASSDLYVCFVSFYLRPKYIASLLRNNPWTKHLGRFVSSVAISRHNFWELKHQLIWMIAREMVSHRVTRSDIRHLDHITVTCFYCIVSYDYINQWDEDLSPLHIVAYHLLYITVLIWARRRHEVRSENCGVLFSLTKMAPSPGRSLSDSLDLLDRLTHT